MISNNAGMIIQNDIKNKKTLIITIDTHTITQQTQNEITTQRVTNTQLFRQIDVLT